MKKISLVLALTLFCFSAMSQTVKPFSLKDFEGKKIVSLFKSTTELRGNYDGMPSSTNQYHTINRSISFQRKGENFLVQKVLSKIHIDIENMITLEHDEFDTEKKFDRNRMASMVYGRYDTFVGKPYKMIYTPQIKRIDTLSNFTYDNFYFDMAWGDDMLPYLQESFVGFFQISLPKESEWKVGQTWEHTLEREKGSVSKNENIINTYTVKSINNNEVILEIKGINIPDKVMYKRSDGYVTNKLKDINVTTTDKINYTIEQKAEYTGIVKLDSKNNFIQKIDISTNSSKKIMVKDSPPSGPETAYIVTIENTLEDLK
jgi:hypothetical protein